MRSPKNLNKGQIIKFRHAISKKILLPATALLLAASGCLANNDPFTSAAFPKPQAPLFSGPGYLSDSLSSSGPQGEFTLVAFEQMVLQGGNRSDIKIDLSRTPQPVESYLFVIDRSRHSVTVLNSDTQDIPEDLGDIHARLTLEVTDAVALAGYVTPDQTVFRFAVQYVPGFVRIVDVTTQTDAVLELTDLTEGTQSTLIQTRLAGLRATLTVDVLDLDREEDENRLEEEAGPISREDKPQQPLNLGESSAGGTINVVVSLEERAPPLAVLPPPTDEVNQPKQDDQPPEADDQPPQTSQPPPEGDGQNDDNSSGASDSQSNSAAPSPSPQPTDPDGETTVPARGGDPAEYNVDVVLVIDSSQSMRFDDNEGDRLQAARSFISTSLNGDRIGIVKFTDVVSVTHLIEVVHTEGETTSSGIGRLRSALDSEPEGSSGLTPSHLGLIDACKELMDNGKAENRMAILFMGGSISSGPDSFLVGSPEKCFIDNGWPIHTVGVGIYDEKLLRQLASVTGGTFRGVDRDNVARLVCEVPAIRSELGVSPANSCQKKHLGQGESTIILVPVPSAQLRANFNLNWLGSETDIEMRLVRPAGVAGPRTVAGRVYTPAGLNVSYDRGAGKSFESYSVGLPEAGTWEIQIIGRAVPPEGVEFVFSFNTVPVAIK